MSLVEINETDPLYIVVAAIAILLFYVLFKIINKRQK